MMTLAQLALLKKAAQEANARYDKARKEYKRQQKQSRKDGQ